MCFCVYKLHLFNSGIDIGAFTVQLHLREDFTRIDFTFGVRRFCHHEEVTGHEQLPWKKFNNNNFNWRQTPNTAYTFAVCK